AFAPTLREMRLSNAAGTSFSFFSRQEPKEFRLEIGRLLAHRQLRHLRVLGLLNCSIRSDGAAALASSSTAANLNDLTIAMDPIGDEGVELLAQSPYLSRIERLTLLKNDLGLASTWVLANSPNAGVLHHLHIGTNNIGDAGVEALANSERLSSLK